VRLRRRSLSPALALALAGCTATEPIPDFDETPAVSVLITPSAYPALHWLAPDSGLSATLVATGTPVRSPYLRADRFEMRRVSDGALFAWRAIDPPREGVGVIPSSGAANYFLPRQQNAGGLGSDSITTGGVYDLLVEVGRYRVDGRTRVPGPVELARRTTDGDSVVRWRRVSGAASYQVWGGPALLTPTPITDTVLIFPQRLRPTGGSGPLPITVFALDSNYAALLSDFRVSRAGISGGWGVFGSFTWGDTRLPASAATARAP
jgi:hypothetical protein